MEPSRNVIDCASQSSKLSCLHITTPVLRLPPGGSLSGIDRGSSAMMYLGGRRGSPASRRGKYTRESVHLSIVRTEVLS